MDAQTRIKIENGQITDKIQKSAIKARSGRMDPMRTSDEDIAKLTGWLVPIADPTLPEGAKPTAETWDRPIITPEHYIDVERIVVTPGAVTMVDEIQIIDGEEITVQVEHREPDTETTVMDSVLVPAVYDYRAYQTVTAYLTPEQVEAERIAAEQAAAAAEVLRKATPIVYDQPLEMPSVILPSVDNGTGYEYFADDDGTLLSIIAHNSPMKSKEERDALKAAIKASRGAAKASWNANKGQGQLQARIEALEAIVAALVG